MKAKAENKVNKVEFLTEGEVPDSHVNTSPSDLLVDNSHGFEEEEEETEKSKLDRDESLEESVTMSDTEDLSDLFETDSEGEKVEEKEEKPLYLSTFEKFYSGDDGEEIDFETHLRQISAAAKRSDSPENDVKVADLDEIDKIFLRADSLLNKKRR